MKYVIICSESFQGLAIEVNAVLMADPYARLQGGVCSSFEFVDSRHSARPYICQALLVSAGAKGAYEV